jgi:hypothetical protein
MLAYAARYLLGISMDSGNHWKPNDWIRLAALIGAFALFGIGAWMLFQEIAAEGVVDLKSSILSGTINSSSAGLYVCFFALFIILFVLATLVTLSNRPTSGAKPRLQRLMHIFWALLLGLGVCGLGLAFTKGFASFGFSLAFSVLAMPLTFVITAIISGQDAQPPVRERAEVAPIVLTPQ